MSRKTFFLAILIGVILIITGCGSQQTKLTAADNGRQLEVKAGQQFIIELEGNPSTGYTWETKDLDAGMFQQIGDAKFTSANPGLAGASGTLSLTFEAIQAGTTTLTLVYHRSWETNVEPINTFTVTVTVK